MARKFKYWAKKGVPSPPPTPVFGNILPMFTLKMNMGQCYREIYRAFPGRDYVGMYSFTIPQVLIRSPQLVEKVLIKDFANFVDHGFDVDEERNWIDLSLFNLTGNKWRAVRNKMTPTFTSGKLKGMMEQMVVCGDHLVSYIRQRVGQDVDFTEMMIAYSTEVVGSCAFGLDVTDWEKTKEFRRMGQKVLKMNIPRYLGFLCMFNLPWLGRALRARFTPTDVAKYFTDIILNNFEDRKRRGYLRNDFVQLLIQLREKGSVEIATKDPDDDYLSVTDSKGVQSFEFTDKMLVAQSFTFVMAGFDAMSSSLLFTALELARHPEVQEKARAEVKQILAKHGEFTYQAVREMTYLDQCINESFRLHPLVDVVFRLCTKEYTMDDGVVIDVGTKVIVPVLALHKDPEYFPEPELFKPERFDPTKNTIPPCTFLPFGAGPRMCIG
ncbi:hypothetical protein AAG570_005244 [Ranatra chinensis]|uniref:Cytochrome P450 n=1 Tax=Ranatra chinensis TaxID=642074 RepID=A0ABD0Y0S5_9HEMI